MKKKTYILTFLMMLCSFAFGQEYHWEQPKGWDASMVVYGKVTINGEVPAADLDLELGAFCGNELRGREKVNLINNNNNRIELVIAGSEGNAITFKLYDNTNKKLLDYECSTVLSFVGNEIVKGQTINFTSKNHWNPAYNTNSNMTVTAKVTINGANVTGDYEIGAFIGDEVCGSARVDANSMAYIVISKNVEFDSDGNAINTANEVTFKLWNHGATSAGLTSEITDITVNYEHNADHGSQSPFVINFNEAVAEVGGKSFATLQAAVNATTTENKEVTILRSFILDNTVTIANNQTVVLNLDGWTVTTAWENESAEKHYYAFTNNGTLTIQGNGIINARGIFNYGTMTLTNGTINAIDGNGGYAVRNYAGTFTMNGGTIATTSEDDNKVDKGGYDASPVRVDEGATFTMNGGVINNICDFTVAIDNYGTTIINDGKATTVHTTLANSGTMTINGGEFTCNGLEGITAHVIWAADGTTTINGGTFNGKDNYNGFNVDASEGAVVNITGGEFLPVHSGSLYGNGTILVSGGTFFDLIVIDRCADGYAPVKNNDNTYTVKSAEAMIDKVGGYEKLEDALAAAQAGKTITLLRDITANAIIVVDKSITLDGNDKTLTYTGSNRAIEMPNVADAKLNVTIKDLNVAFSGSYSQRGINYNDNGTLTLEKVTVNADGKNVTYALNLPGSSDEAKVVINNSSLTGNIALNVWGENAVINATASEFISVDKNTEENYSAIVFNNDGTTHCAGTSIVINGGRIIAKDEKGNPSIAVRNSAVVAFEYGVNYSYINATEIIGAITTPVAIVTYENTTDFYSFTTLQAAIDKAIKTNASSVKLIANIELTESVNVKDNGDVVLNLNGKTITGPTKTISVENAQLTIVDGESNEGKIATTETAALFVGENAKLIVNGGTIYGTGAIMGNGSMHNTEITINGGKVNGNGEIAIYHPQNGTLTINGGTIVGSAGIEMRAGTLTMTAGTVEATGAFATRKHDSGQTVDGAAIALSQHNTNIPVVINVTGGTIKATTNGKAFYQDRLTTTYAESTNISAYIKANVTGAVEANETGYNINTNTDGSYELVYVGCVAKIGDVKYETLEEAVAAAQAGETITMLADVELTSTVKVIAGKKVTLDLNGKTIDGTGKVRIAIMSYGDLTVKDSSVEQTGTIKAGIGTAGNAINICGGTFTLESGSIYSLNNALLIDEEAATVTIKGGKITAEPNTKNSAAFYISSTSETVVNIVAGEIVGYNGILLWNNNKINISGGAISATGSTAIQGNGSKDNTKINISGGTLSGYYAAIYHPQGGELNISGGELTGWTGVVVKGGKVDISGGTINGTGAADTYRPVSSGYVDTGDGLYVEHYDNSTNSENYGTPVVTVTGGTFTSVNGKAVASYANANNNVEAIKNFISGGKFSTKVEEGYCATGFIPTQEKDADGYYGVKSGAYVARNTTTGQGYETLADAIAKANAGETITLLADVESSEVILIDKSLTINGDSHKVTSSATCVFRVTVSNTEVTLNKVNMVSRTVMTYPNDIRGISIDPDLTNVQMTLNECSLDFTDASACDWAYAVNVSGNGTGHTVTVNGGTYEGANVINVHGANNTVVVKNATLNSMYPNHDVYYGACIWVLQNQGSSVEATGNTFNGSNAVAFNLGTGTALTESNNTDNTTICVAKIGNVYYTSLADAFAAAQDDNTIKVLQNIALAESITNTNNVTLDLNGKTVSGTCDASQSSLVYVENNAGLTVVDNTVAKEGKLTFAQGSSNVGWTVDVKGALTLNSGAIELTGKWDIGYAVDVRPNSWGTEYTKSSVFTMNGGSIVSSDGGVRVASSSAAGHKAVASSFVMNDGKIDAAWDGVFVQQSDAIYDVLSFTMNGGTIESDLNPVRVYGPAATGYVNGQDCMNIEFLGGTLSYTGNEAREWVIDRILRVGGGSSIETILESGNITASATFAQNNVLPDGYAWAANNDGTFSAVSAVAKIGTTYYASLQAAADAAENNATITVIKNFTVTETVVVSGEKNITLDINGKTITGSEVLPVIRIQGGANLTVNGGNITNEDGYIFILGASDSSSLGNLTIKGGIYHGATSVASVTYGTLNVNSGEFSVKPYQGSYAYLINCVDANYNDKAKVAISGGIFHNWNPENNAAEGNNTNFCAEGYEAVEIETGVYFVMPKQQITQTTQLNKGWTWFSLYVNIDGENGLGMLQNQLESAVSIKNYNGFTQYGLITDTEYGWYGSLTSISVRDMYMIKVGEAQEISFTAYPLDPSEYTFTLNNGWTWIPYPSRTPMTLDVALANTPSEGDYIKSQDGYAEYADGEWRGSLMTLEPGRGYMYKNVSGAEKQLTYPSVANYRGVAPANVTAASNLMVPNMSKYANNMNITAVVNIDGEELMTEDFEVAAFAGEELRGSARPIYIESIDRYMLFLTVYGEEAEELTFKCYDLNSGEELNIFADGKIVFEVDAIEGSIAQPRVLSRGALSIDETSASSFSVYPNPVNRDNAISFETTFDRVEVYNSLGVKVAEYANVDSIDGIETAGIYVIKAANSNVVRYSRVIVK